MRKDLEAIWIFRNDDRRPDHEQYGPADTELDRE